MMPLVPARRTAGDMATAAAESLTAAAAQSCGASSAGGGSDSTTRCARRQPQLAVTQLGGQAGVERGQPAQAPDGQLHTGTGSSVRGAMKASAVA